MWAEEPVHVVYSNLQRTVTFVIFLSNIVKFHKNGHIWDFGVVRLMHFSEYNFKMVHSDVYFSLMRASEES